MILNFDVKIPLAKQLLIIERKVFCFFVVARKQRLRNFARKARRKADEPLMILLKQRVIDSRLVVKALGKAKRYHADKVPVACLVFTQKHKMVRSVDAAHFVKARSGGNVDLAADDGLDPLFFGRLIKIHTAVHHAVIRNGNGRLPQCFYALHQPLNPAGAVQKAVFRMQMQMCKVFYLFTHALPFPAAVVRFVPAFSCDGKDRIC